jgi:hypothetical protein
MNTNTKQFALSSIIGGGLIAAVLGFAAPAQADVAHYIWATGGNNIGASAPHVDTTVHQSP